MGIAANYLPLALHGLTLWRPGALDAELADADLYAELRHYILAQLLLFPPFWAGSRWRSAWRPPVSTQAP